MRINKLRLFRLLLECAAATAAKSLQSCPTLCDPIDGSPTGPAVPGILQARTLEWVTIFFSNEWKWKVKVKLLSRAWLLVTPWTAAYLAASSMRFSRQEYWSRLPLPSPIKMWGEGKKVVTRNICCHWTVVWKEISHFEWKWYGIFLRRWHLKIFRSEQDPDKEIYIYI